MISLKGLIITTLTLIILLYITSDIIYRKSNNVKVLRMLDTLLNYTVGAFIVLMIIILVIEM